MSEDNGMMNFKSKLPTAKNEMLLNKRKYSAQMILRKGLSPNPSQKEKKIYAVKQPNGMTSIRASVRSE